MANFSFTLNTSVHTDDQIRVTVYRAEITTENIIYNANQAQFKPNMNQARDLANMLEPDMLLLPTPNTLVLVNPHLRIDSQPVPQNLIASGVWRNIHIQNGNHNVQKSFSVLKIRQGAQLCYVAGYEKRLRGYIQDGLLNSLQNVMKYVIKVTIERRRKKKKVWTEVELTENEIKKLHTEILERLAKKRSNLRQNKLELVKNLSKIAKKTNMIEHVVAAIEKNVGKITEKEAPHIVAKKIPMISSIIGIYFGFCRAGKGDIVGALAEVASGVLADVPGPGTAASVTIDVALLAKDIAEAVKNEREHKRLMEHELEDLRRKNEFIKAEMADFVLESPIFGNGIYQRFYDEAEIAYTDDISKIHIRSSDLIDGIQIEYRFGGKSVYHGGQGGTMKAMVLDPHEKITTVEVSTYHGAVSSLSFYTDMGKTESFGKVRGDIQAYELTDGNYLAAIKGYDMFKKENGEATKICPTLPGNREVLPAIGFTAKFE